ncbi:NAD-dependent epimerase/dehydratase family protein [Sphingomonas naphthae]|uniref:NAD-dependent epimerase/dehydratase family protein n=1 Tax=Sphingomonas naphthae TaxID=1813468 RepID=A0ABY7TNN0_9SPHN|nr:NAD-dependent epimerase/dehydratase family protein [Sphingomonas naphthae]WCT74840.1 NAD-dependent epimerase/dehydratase family protein [Sphingomonas naphthae]
MSTHAEDRVFATILLIGASGFVGRYLAAQLRQMAPGARLVCADRTPPAGDGCGIERVSLDLSDARSIDAAVAHVKPSLVFHLAGEASVATAASAERRAWQINTVGSLELALSINEHAPAATLIFASSAEVYGSAFLNGAVSESSAPEPRSTYGKSKLCAEQLLSSALSDDAQLIVVRPTNHIGPGQDRRFALPSFAAQIAAAEATGSAATIRVGNLIAERDFMDVRDVVTAYCRLATISGDLARRETFNVASGTPRSLASMLGGLQKLASVPTSVEVDKQLFREAEISAACVDASRFRAVSGWNPDHSVEETLLDILDEQRTLARDRL